MRAARSECDVGFGKVKLYYWRGERKNISCLCMSPLDIRRLGAVWCRAEAVSPIASVMCVTHCDAFWASAVQTRGRVIIDPGAGVGAPGRLATPGRMKQALMTNAFTYLCWPSTRPASCCCTRSCPSAPTGQPNLRCSRQREQL